MGWFIILIITFQNDFILFDWLIIQKYVKDKADVK